MSTSNKTFAKRARMPLKNSGFFSHVLKRLTPLLALRTKMPSVNAARIRAAREKGSPLMQMVVDISLPETLLYRQSPNPIAMKAVRHPVGEVNGGPVARV